jgi:hypothetical protein
MFKNDVREMVEKSDMDYIKTHSSPLHVGQVVKAKYGHRIAGGGLVISKSQRCDVEIKNHMPILLCSLLGLFGIIALTTCGMRRFTRKSR